MVMASLYRSSRVFGVAYSLPSSFVFVSADKPELPIARVLARTRVAKVFLVIFGFFSQDLMFFKKAIFYISLVAVFHK